MGVLGTGVSGLLSLQRALAVTSQNIANVNTEGYSRQEIEFSARKPQADSGGFIGSGVFVNSVERVYDDFITRQIRTNNSGFNQARQFNALAAQVDSLLADPQAGLMPSLQGFFNAVQGVADDPSSSAARQVMISEAQSLESRFKYLDQRLGALSENVNISVSNAVSEINSLTAAIANVNRDIGIAKTTGSGEPNDLLDQRDLLISRLSEYVSVTTVPQDDGDINVFIGNGQVVVAGTESRQLSAIPNSFDPTRTEVGYVSNNNVVMISEQLSGGILGGTVEFRNQILDQARNALGRIAIGLTSAFNALHASGIDMNGRQGGDFFSPIDTSTVTPVAQVYANTRNTGLPAAQISVTIGDAGLLTTSDYRLERNGDAYSLIRLSDNATTVLTNFPSGSGTVDGLTLSLDSGSMADGDSFLIRPTRNGARNFAVAVKDPNGIAAAGLVRAQPDLANTSDAAISSVRVADPGAYTPDNYSLYAVKSTPASADGASNGLISDAGGTDNALQYQLIVNGTVVYTQNEGDALLSGLDALAGVINDDIAATGVRAYVDNTANTLYFANEPPTAAPVTVTERLMDSNGAPLALDAADSVTGYFGSALNGGSPSNTLNFSGQADSYIALDGSGNTVASGAYSENSAIVIDTLEFAISGSPASGDLFTLTPNTNGVGDNRNALMLAGLQTSKLLDEGRATFEAAYGRFVVDVGTKTRQSEVNRDAQEGLLNQAVAAREEKSGVNLDEEAANLLRFQQAYTAAAQIISTADSMFQTLMDVVRR